MSSPLDGFIEFLEAQRRLHGPRFPEVRADKILSFMGTSSLAGCHPTVSLHRVAGVDGTSNPAALRVRLVGRLPRGPEPGECLSVHLTRLEQYRGFQVKTLPLAAGEPEAGLFSVDGDQLTVNGRRIYTVHHSPYTLRFFEEIPVEEVRRGGRRPPLRAGGGGRDRQPLAPLRLPPRGAATAGWRSSTATGWRSRRP